MTQIEARPAPGGRTAGGLAFDDEGSGEPVVLLHAGVADRRMWGPLVPALSGGHRVIRPDARGFGETLPPLGPWSHHTDLLALLDELLISRAHLVGASMGAGVAVEAALARPEAVASLILAAPGGARADLVGGGRGARSRRSRRGRRGEPPGLGRRAIAIGGRR